MQAQLNHYCQQVIINPDFPIETLEAFLKQLDFTTVNFNVSLGNGETPFLTIVKLACNYNNIGPLKIVLEKADFRTLDFSSNVLPLLFNFSAYYTPVRATLLMILEKMSNDQINKVLQEIKALIFNPLLILGLEGRGKIVKILLSKDKENVLEFNEALKGILLESKEEAVDEILADAFATGKIVVKAEDFLLACCWNGASRAAVAFISKTNQVLNYDMLRLIKAQEHSFSYPALSAILPFYSLYGIPLSQILLDKNFFNTTGKIDLFLKAEERDEILDFLSEQRAVSSVTLAALCLRAMAEEVKEDLAHLLDDDESVIAGNQVARANSHFDKKVEPYFRAQFLGYSPTQNVVECVENIEKEIRIMLLKAIQARSKKEKNKEMNQFIETHFEALSKGAAEAMKASCALFISTCVEHAAWRAYNAYAPVKNRKDHPNLLACHDLSEEERVQSNQIRKKVAYYYLVAMDAPERGMSEAHFMGKVADMQNSNGQNDPTCFPGASTHIGAMGAFHPVAKLPPSIEDILPDFFCMKALAAFAKSEEQDREKLLRALCDLSEETAADIICKKNEYPEELLPLRERFITSLGSPAALLEEVMTIYQGENIGFYLNNMDEKLVAQHQIDVARGKVRNALEAQFIKLTDKPPTEKDIHDLSQENKLLYVLCHYFVKHLPAYRDSLHALKGLATFLRTQKLVVLPENQMKRLLREVIFPSLINIEDHPIDIDQLIAMLRENSLVLDASPTVFIFNEYKRKREEGQKRHLPNKMLASLSEKADLHERCQLAVITHLIPLSAKMETSLPERFLTAMVDEIAMSENKRFNVEQFCDSELKPNVNSVFSEEETTFLLQPGLLASIAQEVNDALKVSFKKVI